MSKTQNIRASRDSKVFDEIALAGSMLYGDLAPDDPAVTDPNVLNATDYTQYFQQTTKNVFQKRNGVWPNIPIATYGGAAGDLNNLVSLGGESLVGVPPVVGPNGQIKGLTSTGGTVNIVDNGTSLDLEVQNITGGVKNNFTATRFPNFNDNLNDGYTPGSVWVDTSLDSGNKSFTCVRSTLVSATWKPTSNELYFQVDVPDNQQDSQFGYLEGSVIWTPDSNYISIDDTINQAKWSAYGGKEGEVKWNIRKELNPSLDESYNIEFKNDGGALKIKNDFSGNLPAPGSGDDSTQGWTVGSKIKDNDSGFMWNCEDASEGGAVWSSDMGIGYIVANQITNLWNEGDVVIMGATDVNTGSYSDIFCFANNWLATTNPTTQGNDNGYVLGSMWRNSVTNEVFVYANSTWNSITSPIVSTKAVAHYGYKFIDGQVLPRPTFDSPEINVTMYVPLRMGGPQQGQSQTLTPQPGHNPASLFVNSNLASENCALQYTGTIAGWYNVTVYLQAIKPQATDLYNWRIQLWSDTAPNPLTVSFDRSDPQIEGNEDTSSNFPSLAAQSVSFLRYFTPNEYIGVAVKAIPNSGMWLSSVDNISIKLAPA